MMARGERDLDAETLLVLLPLPLPGGGNFGGLGTCAVRCDGGSSTGDCTSSAVSSRSMTIVGCSSAGAAAAEELEASSAAKDCCSCEINL